MTQNIFVKYDSVTLQVTAILYDESDRVDGFLKLKKPLPVAPDTEEKTVLRLNYDARECYYDFSDDQYTEFRLDTYEATNAQLKKENATMKKDLADLQDMVLYLMMM